MDDLDVVFTECNLGLRMVKFETTNGERSIQDIFEGDKKSILRILAKMLKVEERIEFRKKH